MREHSLYRYVVYVRERTRKCKGGIIHRATRHGSLFAAGVMAQDNTKQLKTRKEDSLFHGSIKSDQGQFERGKMSNMAKYPVNNVPTCMQGSIKPQRLLRPTASSHIDTQLSV